MDDQPNPQGQEQQEIGAQSIQSDNQSSQDKNSSEESVIKSNFQKDFQANDNCLKELISLGIDKNAARKALYFTANDSVEKV